VLNISLGPARGELDHGVVIADQYLACHLQRQHRWHRKTQRAASDGVLGPAD
jgi:hypothetical protein